MNRIHFSLKKLNVSVFLFVGISILITTVLLALISFLTNTLLSYTKGSSLLITYSQNYVFSVYDKNLFSQEEKVNLEKKIQGFYAFYELLFFKERPQKEIESLWLDFGMTKQEIQTVILGTKVMRNFPILDKIKLSAENVKNKLDIIKNASLLEKENIKEILHLLEEFNYNFYSTMTPLISFVLIISSILISAILIFFGYYIITNLIPLNRIIKVISEKFNLILKKEKFDKVDIIDPRSECIVLQEAVNSISDKFKIIENKKEEISNKMNELISSINEKMEITKNNIEALKEVGKVIGNIKVDAFEKELDTFNKSFSLIDSEIKDIVRNFEKLRSVSVEIFEPIETTYEIIEKASTKYKLIKDISLNYISETQEISKSITNSLEKSYKDTTNSLENLKKTSLNLRGIGINATIEFSRISSSEQSLTNIGSKIVELSRDLSKIFADTKSALEKLQVEIKQDITRINNFAEALKESDREITEISSILSTLAKEKEKATNEIDKAQKSLSEIINSISSINEQKETILRSFFQIDNALKNLREYIEITSKIQSTIEELTETYEVIKSINTEVSKEISKISEI